MQKKPLAKAKPGARTVALAPESPAASNETVTGPVVPVNTIPTHDDIARRAYEIYVARGQVSGRELEDWIEAERELLAKCHCNN